MKVGLGLLLCPLLWVWFALPGAMQIAVSMGAVLNLDFYLTKQKSLMRVYGCFVGAGLAMITLVVLRVESLTVLLVLIFAVAYYCSYLHNSPSRFAYLGTQALVAFLMGVIVNFSPSLIPDPAVERLFDITAGVLFLYGILVYLWPFSAQALRQHYQGQIAEHLHDVEAMTLAYLRAPHFNLLRAMEQPLRMLKRDAGQAAKLKIPLPDYARNLDQLEAFLVFISIEGVALQAYQSVVQVVFESMQTADPVLLRHSVDGLLQSMRAQTLQGDFMPLQQIIMIGAFMRMVQVFMPYQGSLDFD